MIIELTPDERKLVDYALCFLKANMNEWDTENLDMPEHRIHDIILDIKAEIN